jgi:class 3 adenylate cyclase
MAHTHPRFETLRRVADARVVDVLERFATEAEDDELCRINAIEFAADHGLPDELVIDAFVHSSKLGLFEMSWNLLCPGCGGVLDAYTSLRGLRKETYSCALCAAAYQPTLDETVEVTFTVSPAVRTIRHHNPESLPAAEYCRTMYFGGRLALPRGASWDNEWREITIEADEVPPGGKVIFSVQLPSEFVILFEPVVHAAVFIESKGEPTRERRELTVIYNEKGASALHQEMAPGPLRLTIENQTGRRIVPGLFIAGERFHNLFVKSKPFLTAKRMFTNQTFRDLYRTDTLDVDQRLRIARLTVLFTDLKGSTELYDRVGDLAAYDLVREHFKVLTDVVRAQSGAVVKTIGDAVMATFPSPLHAVTAAMSMRDAIDRLNSQRGADDLLVKIGVHQGPCLAVVSNERLDYFGQTVNIAARVQGLATSRPIFATDEVIADEEVRDYLSARGIAPSQQRAALKGVADEVTVYEIP